MGQKNESISPFSGSKVNNVSPSLEQGASYMPAFFYNYPGHSGTYGQADDKGHVNASGDSYMPDNTSPFYYPYGYVPYTTGIYDATYSGDGSMANYGLLNPTMMDPNDSGSNTDARLSNKAPTLPYDSMVHNQWVNLAEPMYHNLPLNSSNKFDFGFQPTNLIKGYNQTSEFSSVAKGKPSVFMPYFPSNYYQSNGRTWNYNNNYKQKARQSFGRNNTAIEGLTELARGPRSERKNSLKNDGNSEQPLTSIERGAYNSQDFKIEYDHAKFFVIKSFSEDDVQRSLKYNVWSSTPNGNKKLDASFREAEAKANETSQKCPIFLFFSVNGSGQFIGVAEMVGKVDFTKNMDFWQVDKWSGFFPVKWHVIKDVPNTNLKHIILENNENKAVTHSRDTQEVGLKQGLEMLSIFKNYTEQSSLLNDFDFYEKRAKELKAKRNAKASHPRYNGFERSEYEKCLEELAAANTEDSCSALASLTNNLSLGS